MAISYHIDVGQQCVFVKLDGETNEWDIGMALQQLWQDSRLDPSFSRFIDGTGAIPAPDTGNFIKAVAGDTRRRTKPIGKIAFVASSEQVYNSFRMYRAYAKREQCQIFRDKFEALSWLGVHEPESIA